MFGCKLDFLSRKSINHFDSMASKNTFVTNEACGKRCAFQIFIQTFVFSTFDRHASKSVVYWKRNFSESSYRIIFLPTNASTSTSQKKMFSQWMLITSMFSQQSRSIHRLVFWRRLGVIGEGSNLRFSRSNSLLSLARSPRSEQGTPLMSTNEEFLLVSRFAIEASCLAENSTSSSYENTLIWIIN